MRVSESHSTAKRAFAIRIASAESDTAAPRAAESCCSRCGMSGSAEHAVKAVHARSASETGLSRTAASHNARPALRASFASPERMRWRAVARALSLSAREGLSHVPEARLGAAWRTQQADCAVVPAPERN